VAAWPCHCLCQGGAQGGVQLFTWRTQTDETGWARVVSSDDVVTPPTITHGRPDFAIKSNFPLRQVGDYLFICTTDSRGDETDMGEDGWKPVDVYLAIAPIADVVAQGAAAFRFVKIEEASHWNHTISISDDQVSPVGVGTILAQDGYVECFYSEGERQHVPLQPLSRVSSVKIDVTPWTGGAAPPALSADPSVHAFTSIARYTNVAAVAAGGVFRATDRLLDTMPGVYDPASGTFTPPISGHYRIDVTVLPNSGAEFYLRVHEVGAAASYASPWQQAANPYLVWADTDPGQDLVLSGTSDIYLFAGRAYEIRVGAGSVNASSVRNALCIAYLR